MHSPESSRRDVQKAHVKVQLSPVSSHARGCVAFLFRWMASKVLLVLLLMHWSAETLCGTSQSFWTSQPQWASSGTAGRGCGGRQGHVRPAICQLVLVSPRRRDSSFGVQGPGREPRGAGAVLALVVRPPPPPPGRVVQRRRQRQ